MIVAESHGNRLTAYDIGQNGDLGNRRTWADAGEDHPDGIYVDAKGAIWYADVANHIACGCARTAKCSRRSSWTEGAFACTLSRGDQPQLYVVGQEFGGPEAAESTGQVVALPLPAPGAGHP
ncbi:MAG: SMP-30/gluconolactonase/LRE family protein [Jiangellaceae bacterium]